MGEASRPVIGRRQFIRGAGAAGLGTIVVASLRPQTAGAATTATKVKVWRLSTRRQSVCGSCKGHAASRYYRLRRFANNGRAHLGCNCALRHQKIDQQLWVQYFVKRDRTLRKVWDVRWKPK